jgi:UDP-glucose 4-epimerase
MRRRADVRVLVTGMGGDFGAKTAALIEADPAVEAVLGLDAYPPRRRLHRCEFGRIAARDGAPTTIAVRDFAPTVVVHLGVWEPDARAAPSLAHQRTMDGTRAALGAAVSAGKLDHVIVRSGIEVYGRGPGTPRRPDEDVPLRPTSPYGRTLRLVEQEAAAAGRMAEVPVALLRFAPTVGVQYPSPLSRVLRLPAVPVNALSFTPIEPAAFALLDVEDAAAAFVGALRKRVDGAVNVVPEGTITPLAAARLGGRLPLPIIAPGWIGTRLLSRAIGAPIPSHLHELLLRGREADGTKAADVLGVTPQRPTDAVVRALYDWAPVVYLRPGQVEVA